MLRMQGGIAKQAEGGHASMLPLPKSKRARCLEPAKLFANEHSPLKPGAIHLVVHWPKSCITVRAGVYNGRRV